MIHFRRSRWYTHARKLLPAHREQICRWLNDNGVDHMQVYQITVRGNRIHLDEYKLNANGKRYVDRHTGEPARTHRSVRLKTEPPELTLDTPERQRA